MSKIPGPNKLIAGDLERGFYGEVPSSEMISGEELAKLVGVTQGTSQFSDTNWLKWSYKGKTLFRPKKAIRHSISWDHLNEKNLVYGDRVIEVGGLQYKIRLMKSVAEGYETAEGDRKKTVPNSEWNHLMLPIHIEAKDGSWYEPSSVEDDVPYWGIDYTDKDLHTHYKYGNGTYVWCQEHWNSGSSYRVGRGGNGVSLAYRNSSGTTDSGRGWAPVLELLAPSKPPHKILIKKDGEYGYYDELEFVSLGSTPPNEKTFEKHGMDWLSELDEMEKEITKSFDNEENGCYRMKFDLSGRHKKLLSIDELVIEEEEEQE